MNRLYEYGHERCDDCDKIARILQLDGNLLPNTFEPPCAHSSCLSHESSLNDYLRPVGSQDHHEPVTGGAGVVEESVESITCVLGHGWAGSFAQERFRFVDEQQQAP